MLKTFDLALDRLGPFGAPPLLALAVSGGADSTALALLAQGWAARHGGGVMALIVDHGLRAGAADEAALTRERLAARGILARVLTLVGLGTGAKLQARARAARYVALMAAARAAGCLHLLVGHHAQDQRETVAMRAVRGARGLEGMAAWAARGDVILVRPLLGIEPGALRAFLRAEGMEWIEDPSNADARFERVRLRQEHLGMDAAGGDVRRAEELSAARFLAGCTIRPEGFAVIHGDSAFPAALAVLLRMAGGADYAPPLQAVARLAARLQPASLGGVLIQKTTKFGGGWLLAREPAACAPPVPALAGVAWDRRFRLRAGMARAMFGGLRDDAVKYRRQTDLPSLVLRGMPCLRAPSGEISFPINALFTPPLPATSLPFAT